MVAVVCLDEALEVQAGVLEVWVDGGEVVGVEEFAFNGGLEL